MDRISTAQAATMPVEFKLNGRAVVGRSDETLIETSACSRLPAAALPRTAWR
jgi:hypothetical protein